MFQKIKVLKFAVKKQMLLQKKKKKPRVKVILTSRLDQNSQKRINPMELWLRRYGTVDKDKAFEENARQEKLNDINYLKTLAPEATIDLHQLTREEAWDKLKIFVDSCYIRKLKKILIIHGKGNHSHGTDPVLGQLVRLFIEQDKRLGTSGHPDRNHGGSGATWVIIKN